MITAPTVSSPRSTVCSFLVEEWELREDRLSYIIGYDVLSVNMWRRQAHPFESSTGVGARLGFSEYKEC